MVRERIQRARAIRPLYKRLMLINGFKRVKDLVFASKCNHLAVERCVFMRHRSILEIRVRTLVSLAAVLRTTPGSLMDRMLEEDGVLTVPGKKGPYATWTPFLQQMTAHLNRSLTDLDKCFQDPEVRDACKNLIWSCVNAVPTVDQIVSKRVDLSTISLLAGRIDSLVSVLERLARVDKKIHRALGMVRTIKAYFDQLLTLESTNCST